MSVESRDDNKQEIRKLLEEKEAMVAHGPNGTMRVRRPRKSKADEEKLKEALKRVKKKLGVEETNALKASCDIYKNSRRHLRTTQIHRTTHHFRTTPVVRTLPFIFIYVMKGKKNIEAVGKFELMIFQNIFI